MRLAATGVTHSLATLEGVYVLHASRMSCQTVIREVAPRSGHHGQVSTSGAYSIAYLDSQVYLATQALIPLRFPSLTQSRPDKLRIRHAA
jgi:hypothetical protein